MKDNNKVISGMRKSANPNLNKIALELKKSQSDIDWHKIALSVNKNVVDDDEKIDFFFYHQTKGILILYENCFSIGFRNEVSTLNKIVNTYVKIFEKKVSDSFSEIFEANINNLYFKLSYLRAALSTVITMHSPSVSDLIKNAEEIIYKVEDYYGLVRFSRDIGRTVINNEIHPDFVSLKNHINEQLEYLRRNTEGKELNINQPETRSDRIKRELIKLGFDNLEFVKSLNTKSRDTLLNKLSSITKIPEAVAYLNEIKFFIYLESQHGNKTNANRKIQKVYSNKSTDYNATQIRHLRNSLMKPTNKFNAKKYTPEVVEFLEKLK